MPINSNARREKGKKKDKKKKTDPSPLHKEDKASKDKGSMDSSSLSLSLAEKDAASLDRSSLSLSLVGTDGTADLSDPRYLESTLLLEFQRSLTEDERFDMHGEVVKANPGVTSKSLQQLNVPLCRRQR
jgi:hypothetical protein